jgi:hypothetical protein
VHVREQVFAHGNIGLKEAKELGTTLHTALAPFEPLLVSFMLHLSLHMLLLLQLLQLPRCSYHRYDVELETQCCCCCRRHMHTGI